MKLIPGVRISAYMSLCFVSREICGSHHAEYIKWWSCGLHLRNVVPTYNSTWVHNPADGRHTQCYRHGRWRPSFGLFCAFKVTCPPEPVSFSRFLCAVSLCFPSSIVPVRQYRFSLFLRGSFPEPY